MTWRSPRIARAIRERDGGLPRVQALGLLLDELGCAQVSMNLLDSERHPHVARVGSGRERLAGAAVSRLRESELIGLAPEAALLDVADHVGVDPHCPSWRDRLSRRSAVRIRDFHP